MTSRVQAGPLVYKALRDATVAYLVDDCQLVSHAGRRRLRSADIDTCCVPRLGDRSFAAAGPRLWNNLPARIRHRGVSAAAVWAGATSSFGGKNFA